MLGLGRGVGQLGRRVILGSGLVLVASAACGDDASDAGPAGSAGSAGAAGAAVGAGTAGVSGKPSATGGLGGGVASAGESGAASGGVATSGGQAGGGGVAEAGGVGGNASAGEAAAGAPGRNANAGVGAAAGTNGSAGVAGEAAGGAGGQGTEADKCGGNDPAGCLSSVTGKLSDFGSPLSSSWFLLPCLAKNQHDCRAKTVCDVSSANPEDQGSIIVETFPIGGVPGQHYKVTFTFNAIAAAKVYSGGSRDSGTNVGADPDAFVHDAFYRDGAAIVSNYDVWQLAVYDEEGSEARHYFMNSFPNTTFETHRTYLLSYSKSIVVVGGGSVRLRTQDRNCQSIDNCGPGEVVGTVCKAPRNIPNEPANVPLPAQYFDPESQQLRPTATLNVVTNSAAQPWHSELGHLTITAVEKTDQPVTHDY